MLLHGQFSRFLVTKLITQIIIQHNSLKLSKMTLECKFTNCYTNLIYNVKLLISMD